MSARRFPIALAVAIAVVVAVVVANAALAGWLAMAPVAAGAPDVASAWRQGALVRRQVAAGDARAAFASELAIPGTTLVIEHPSYEGRAMTLTRHLFAASFLAGRDGVHAILDGRDVYLTPHDLVQAHLYRRTSPGRLMDLVEGIDADGVLDRLARALSVPPDRLWKEGRFRRFTATRTILPEPAADPDPTADLRRTKAASPARVALALEDIARYLSDRMRPDGRFPDLLTAGTGGGYDWPTHAAATAFLAETGVFLQSHPLKGSARRAAWLIQKTATARCGASACVTVDGHGDLAVSAMALIAYAELARERAGVTFIGPTNDLAGFLRGQQGSDGGFAATFDLGKQKPDGGHRADASAAAAQALGRASRISKNRADMDAAQEGIDYLTGRPALVGLADFLGADHRVCDAVEETWDRFPNPAGLEFCQAWTDWTVRRQMEARTPIAAYGGGFRDGAGWLPGTIYTANRVEGIVATVGAALRAGHKPDSVKALDIRASRAFEFLLREQLPGPNAHLLPDPQAVAGAFTSSPVDLEARTSATAAAGSAMLRLLRVLESRGMPSPAKVKREANKIAMPKD